MGLLMQRTRLLTRFAFRQHVLIPRRWCTAPPPSEEKPTACFSELFVMGKGKKLECPFTTPATPTTIGEDSYYTLTSPSLLSFGVADGVGGWTLEKDGRPDLVAQQFMKHCESVAREYVDGPKYGLPITSTVASQIIFAQAYERLQANPPGLGSCTAVVVNISREMKHLIMSMHIVGDSGVIVLRRKENSPEYQVLQGLVVQQMGGAPLQIACKITPEMEEEGVMNNRPGEGIPGCILVKPDDILLAASDGLWDNRTTEEILRTCNRLVKSENLETSFCEALLSTIMRDIQNQWRKYDDVTMIAVKV